MMLVFEKDQLQVGRMNSNIKCYRILKDISPWTEALNKNIRFLIDNAQRFFGQNGILFWCWAQEQYFTLNKSCEYSTCCLTLFLEKPLVLPEGAFEQFLEKLDECT